MQMSKMTNPRWVSQPGMRTPPDHEAGQRPTALPLQACSCKKRRVPVILQSKYLSLSLAAASQLTYYLIFLVVCYIS